ncbi:MAG TPA: nucleotide exchange factor GrpE [Terracidiphilus sp.]|jgi:molecular chaperone GrpE|nr:nucleotide exchange factor GrpE [Terracidiphilus sp.]
MPKQETGSTVIEKEQADRQQTGQDAGREDHAQAAERGLDPSAELPPPENDSIQEPDSAEAAARDAAPEAAAAERAEIEKLKAERDQLLDRLARLQAEFDNARKRAEREKADFRDFATGNVIEQFLPVVDNFELALKATGSAEQLRSGVELIVKQMEEILNKMQVSPVPAVGQEFDPRVHEALGTVERSDVPDHFVAEEVRRGYKLRDRLLRPALVRVAHNPRQVSE